MPLPEPVLDDLRFQKDLVDEARRRIIRYCPEWTDYNLSDPGITLIELFAWMTELIVYRLNLVPEKNYIRFMDFLGIQLQTATSARTELTFRLSIPFPIRPDDSTTTVVPSGTEVATRETDESPEIIFTTDKRLVIAPVRLIQLRRHDKANENFLDIVQGQTVIKGNLFNVFCDDDKQPQSGDTFYLGFDEAQNISGYMLELDIQSKQTEAFGIRRDDPPLVWEVSRGDNDWVEVTPSNRAGEIDTTGGLNNPRGHLVLYLPLDLKPDSVHGRKAYWLRCRFEQRREEQGVYRETPHITSLTPYVLGASTRATHAVVVQGEVLGVSTGEAGQTYSLNHTPILLPREGETVEVEEMHDGDLVWIPWNPVGDFSESNRYDRHFTLNIADGELLFGPNLRQPDGSVRQYGSVPEAGRTIRFSRYRYGGGVAGNLPPDKIQVLKTSIPYIDRVNNMTRSVGGRDQESLDEAKMRARRELRAQQRAVTAEDYENMAKASSRLVARVKYNHASGGSTTLAPGTVELLVIPAAFDAVNVGDLSKLVLDPPLRQLIEQYVDQYRLLTASLKLREPSYIGVKVQADIVVSEFSRPDVVRQRVVDALRNFITPLALDDSSGSINLDDAATSNGQQGTTSEGWPFGRNLYASELYTLIAQVPGVKHVRDVKLGQRPVIPSQEKASSDGNPAEVPLSDQRVIEVQPDAVLCSLNHEVNSVTL